MIEKELSELSKVYEAMGFNEQTEKPRLKAILYALMIPFLVGNEVVYIINNWDNMENRVNGFMAICMYVTCALYIVAILFMWKDTKLLIKVIKGNRYKFPFQLTTKRTYLERKIEEDARKLNTIWYYVLMTFMANGILTSVLVFLVQIARFGIKNVTADMLYLTFPFYYPKNYNTLLYYFLSFLMQSFVYIESAQNSQLTVVASIICMKLIEGDLKLLRLSLEEMDTLIIYCTTNVNQSDFHSNKDDIGMKMYLKYFVSHHNDIYRKVNEATKGLKVMASTLCSAISLMICMTIYSLVKGNVIVFKIQEFCFCCSALYCKYCLDLMGENISNEGRNLRLALYQINWIDKPLWFKKSLKLIMTRTNNTIKIRSMGFFTLDLKSYVMTLQAAYSFYNMLINLN